MTTCDPDPDPTAVDDVTAPPSTDSGRLAALLVELVSEAIDTEAVHRGISAIVALLVDGGLADSAGVTLLVPDGNGFRTVAQSNETVRILDALQYRTREGPSVHAATTMEVTVVDRVVDDPRWPTWAPRAALAGVAAVVSVPIHHRRTRFGALNLYRRLPPAHENDHLEVALLGAAHIATLLAHDRVGHHLQRAVDTRTVIGQAQGVLMERSGLTSEQAFALLRSLSQHNKLKLHEVAAELIATRHLPDSVPEPGPESRAADPAPSDD